MIKSWTDEEKKQKKKKITIIDFPFIIHSTTLLKFHVTPIKYTRAIYLEDSDG